MLFRHLRTSLVARCIGMVFAAALGPVSLVTQRALAQAPESLPPEVAAELARSPKPPLPNQVVGIDIDQFIGSPLLSAVRVTHGTIFQRSILRHGNPYHPNDPGAVLEYRKDLSLGVLPGSARTSLDRVPDEQFWYVESGKARLDNGDEYWNLHEGVGVLIPPNIRHRLENTSDEPMQMLVLTWSPDPAMPQQNIVVRDNHSLTLPAQGAHWNYFGTDLFTHEDGLDPREQFAIVFMPPMTIAEPHAHIPHWEEVWTKLPPFSSFMMLGSEVREMPPNTAFLAPPNSQTTHSVVNLTRDKTQAWLYIGRAVWNQRPRPARPLIEPRSLKELR
jgi:mannose-6-phosphate isomerase-like protein (cupin superfamily)